jgi:hypothetical protein
MPEKPSSQENSPINENIFRDTELDLKKGPAVRRQIRQAYSSSSFIIINLKTVKSRKIY